VLSHNQMHLFVVKLFLIFLFDNKWVLDARRTSQFKDDSETFHIDVIR
jgi:hypothetical protein